MEYLELNNGVKMPILGYGTYQIPNNEVQRCAEDAISVGYRLIDTAQAYANEEGKIRAIGVSNFYADKITDFCAFNDIKPAINQIEMHPLFQKVDEQKINNDLGVAVQSWASFAEGKSGMFSNKVLKTIGQKYGKTPAQVILRWLIERKVVVIPKTTRKARMEENFNVFDFKLTADDKAKIAKLDTGKTQFLDHRDPQTINFLANYKAK